MSVIKGKDPVSQLYRAVERYVKAKGGNVVIIGGIQIQQCLTDGAFNFSVAIKVTGQKPQFAQVEDGGKQG